MNPTASGPDPFDPMSLRITGDSGIRFEKPLHTIPLRKPGKQEYFRVCPDEDFSGDFWGIDFEQDKGSELYIVAEACCDLVTGQVHARRIFTCISRDGVIFLWPVKLPGDGETRFRSWPESALILAEEAKQLWCGQMHGNMHLGAYEWIQAQGDLGEPKWPDKTFTELLTIAFRDRVINSADHPVIRRLNGDL